MESYGSVFYCKWQTRWWLLAHHKTPLTVLVYGLESSSFALNVFELERMSLDPGKHAGECRAMIADRGDNQTFCKTQIQIWMFSQLARAASLCSHNPGRGLSNKVTNIDRSGKFGCSCHSFFFFSQKERGGEYYKAHRAGKAAFSDTAWRE